MKLWITNSLRNAAWAPLTVFVFYAVAAKGFDAYLIYPWLDIPTHFCGGMAITYFYMVAISHSQNLLDPFPKLIQLVLSLGLTAISAVIWEFLEFSSDAVWSTKMNLGVSDTLSDLFFGLLGGIIVITFAANKPSWQVSTSSKGA
jgi:UDP-N-acetylmuramyl pentapeptide phosphotransferase/UDP-N-acetylglucosamine-1-phosphate transferase